MIYRYSILPESLTNIRPKIYKSEIKHELGSGNFYNCIYTSILLAIFLLKMIKIADIINHCIIQVIKLV